MPTHKKRLRRHSIQPEYLEEFDEVSETWWVVPNEPPEPPMRDPLARIFAVFYVILMLILSVMWYCTRNPTNT